MTYDTGYNISTINRGHIYMLGRIRDIAVITLMIMIVLGGVIVVGMQTAKDMFTDFCLFDCGAEDEIDITQIVQKVEQQAWIEGARKINEKYELHIKRDRPGPLGTDSLRYDAYVTITAGVDLEWFTEEDIDIQGNNLVIYLPSPQIRDCILNEQDSRFHDDNCAIAGVIPTGVCDDLEDELRMKALSAASAADADHSELLSQAFEGASETVLKLVENIEGVEKVTIEQSPKEIPLFSSAGTCDEYQTGR